MAHPLYHARSSANQFGGEEADYYALHTFFDQTKMCLPTNLHRMLLHNEFGIAICEQVYGLDFPRVSDGVKVSTYKVGRQHVTEDFGFIPTLAACMEGHPLRRQQHRSPLLTPEEQTLHLAKKLGGQPEDYRALVAWFCQPGDILEDAQFFRLLGNSFGIFLSEERFGISITRSSDRHILPTRYVAETLVQATLGSIPTLSQFFHGMVVEAWMCKGARRLSEEFEA